MWKRIFRKLPLSQPAPTRSAASRLALIELNLLELNVLEAESRLGDSLAPPLSSEIALEEFLIHARLVLSELPPVSSPDNEWENLRHRAHRLNADFADLRMRLAQPMSL